jgi:hypothetical protein
MVFKPEKASFSVKTLKGGKKITAIEKGIHANHADCFPKANRVRN